MKRPLDMVLERTRMLDELDGRARRAIFAQIELGRAHLASSAAALSALSPLQVLTRGYSVTLSESGEAIRDAKQVQPGDLLRTRLHQGEVWSRVDHDADESR